MSGGSFNYLCNAENLASRSEDLASMVAALEALAADREPHAAEAAAESQVLLAQAEAVQQAAWSTEEAAGGLRSVWHDVEWWYSRDYGRDRVVQGLERYGAARAKRPAIEVAYRNHRGEVALRRVRPLAVRHGSTEHHPEPQWLLEVWDVDKEAARTFALADCDFARRDMWDADRPEDVPF